MTDPRLLEIVVCPRCHSTLRSGDGANGNGDGNGEELVCTGTSCGLVFPVRQGVPVLLVDEAGPGTGAAAATSANEGDDHDREDERGH